MKNHDYQIECFALLPGKDQLAFARIEISARLDIVARLDLPSYLPGYYPPCSYSKLLSFSLCREAVGCYIVQHQGKYWSMESKKARELIRFKLRMECKLDTGSTASTAHTNSLLADPFTIFTCS